MISVGPGSHVHHDDVDDSTIVVEEVYEEDGDPDMEELLRVNGDHDMRYEEEEDRSDGDEYGGMTQEIYNNIVEYKRSGAYPPDLNNRHDRSATSHWRSRCLRFVLADDMETLLYYNPTSSVNDQAKVVVKKGEVRRVLERIHELIGHLGQKRTQMVVLKKLHWRSVRQDVKTYIMNCNFCNQKKLEGKKILKAPVDISSEHFGINIEVRSKAPEDGSGAERLSFSLLGYNEHEVQAAAMTRMTSYTFKETAPDLRGGRYSRTKSEYSTSASRFRRQPYIKRSRYGAYPASYILPYAPKGNREEPEYIIYADPRQGSANNFNGETEEVYETVEELVERRPSGSHLLVGDVNGVQSLSHGHHGVNDGDNDMQMQRREVKTEPPSSHSMGLYESAHHNKRVPIMSMRPSATGGKRKRSKFCGGPGGTAARFSMAVGDGDRDIAEHSSDLLTPMEAAQSRPELLGIAPIMLMPTVDPEVVMLQKELLTRQLRIQALQEKVLHSQFESMRIPIARYEEIDPRGDRMQIVSHDVEGEVIEVEEGVDMDQELNVMDSGDEDVEEEPGIEVLKEYNQGMD